MNNEIKRYGLSEHPEDCYIYDRVDGEYVKHADHLAAIAELRSRLEKAEWEISGARTILVKDCGINPIRKDDDGIKNLSALITTLRFCHEWELATLTRERDALRTALETIAGYEVSEEISSSEEELRTTETARNALDALKTETKK